VEFILLTPIDEERNWMGLFPVGTVIQTYSLQETLTARGFSRFFPTVHWIP